MNKQISKIEKKQNKHVVYSMGNKKVVWLSEINKYLVVEPVVAEIILATLIEDPQNKIIELCYRKFEIDKEQISSLIEEIQKTLSELLNSYQKKAFKLSGNLVDFTSKEYVVRKYYNINNIKFFVEYESPRAVEINHPKFSNFEIQAVDQFDHHIKVFHQYNTFSLQVNGKNRGAWNDQDDHFLGGKFSMEILQQLYHKEENEWLGVFHAAGISNGKKCILFLGDSGNGKSTLSALLMAAGFEVLSDDFLPVVKENKQVCRFPAAISVKKSAIPILSTCFPELDHSTEYSNQAANKIFRFLPQNKTDLCCVPCVALVFVKYNPNSVIQLSKLQKDVAFQKLVPDSWISPLEDNVKDFFQWFDNLPCCQLNYSDNEAMIATVKSIFRDECS
nr:hypothetical protein [uncultured Draconibacterium sp.]